MRADLAGQVAQPFDFLFRLRLFHDLVQKRRLQFERIEMIAQIVVELPDELPHVRP